MAARNPYYYKVDPAGHQLPYIDKVALDVVQDPQAVVLKAINGQIDMQTQYLIPSTYVPSSSRTSSRAITSSLSPSPPGPTRC